MGVCKKLYRRGSAKIVLIVVLAVLASPGFLRAQEAERKTAREQAQIQAQMEQMAPLLRQMSLGAMDLTLEVLSQKETADRLADFTRNFYEALLARRFTKVEALDIVKAVGIPHLSALR
jgi:type II secretory pathway pseudopilin PulG